MNDFSLNVKENVYLSDNNNKRRAQVDGKI